ncbi:MAG: hypothetical protein L3K23_10385 [Thermoplasmata archaeon]|nr:hypothetical protein [Thermoplasmata archaeon]
MSGVRPTTRRTLTSLRDYLLVRQSIEQAKGNAAAGLKRWVASIEQVLESHGGEA